MIIKKKEGFIKFRRIGKPHHKLFEIERIEVSEECQRRGCATKLFNMMIEKIKPYRKLFCTTHFSNKVAQKFYESMGMRAEAVLPNHYYRNEPEIVYSSFGVGEG